MSSSRIRSRLQALLVAAASAIAAAAPTIARAQAPADRPDPLDARAPVAPLQYRSAFDGYRRFADEPVRSWGEANETVGRIGGWKVYAREAGEPGAGGEEAARDRRPDGVPGRTHGDTHHERGVR